MGITSRRKRPLDRGKVEFRDAQLFIIATEGELTEPQYFEMFRSTRIQIEILPTVNGASAPGAVLDRLDKYSAKYDLDDEDRLFLVIDRDSWPEKALSEVAQHCAPHGYELAVSNPCFEFWIYLHFAGGLVGHSIDTDFDAEIRSVLGEYNKKNLKPEKFSRAAVKAAIERAKKLDTSAGDRWPQSLGTRAYLVAEAIVDSCKLPGE